MNESQKLREEYFRNKGLGAPPTDQEERYQLAQKLTDQSRPDYKAALMLFDTEEDENSSKWLCFMGELFSRYDNSYQDNDKSKTFLLASSRLGNGRASFILAWNYLTYADYNADLRKAVKFLKLSIGQGYDQAIELEREVSRYIDEVYQITDNEKIRYELFDNYRYFKKHDLGIPPVSQEERRNKARNLITGEKTYEYEYKAARKLFVSTIDSNDPEWLYLLGTISNRAKQYSDSTAFKFYRKAADKGHGLAAYYTSLMYEEGEIIPRNQSKADHYTNIALKYIDSQVSQGEIPTLLSQYGQDSISTALESKLPSSPADELLAKQRSDRSYINRFIVSITGLQKLQRKLLKQSGYSSTEDYFTQKHGAVSLNMANQNHRLKLFEIFSEKRQGISALLAIDPLSDLCDAEMIKDVGFFLQWPDSDVYAPEISENLFFYGAVRFAEDNNFSAAMCAFRLGHHYNNGNTGRVDHNASIFWFETAMLLGHGVAPKFLYQIYASEDDRFGDPDEPEFNAYMDGLMEHAEQSGFPCSTEWINRKYAFGAGKYNDQKRVISGYESMIEEQFLAPPQLSSLMAYAMRTVLLDDISRSYEDIISNINAGIEKNQLQSFYVSSLEVPLRQLEKLRERLSSSNEYYSKFRATADKIRGFYYQTISEEDFDKHVDTILNTSDTVTAEAARDALWLGRTLGREEGWKITRKIAKAFEKAHTKCLGLDEETLKRSALIMGPMYNPLSPDNAMPVLGEHLPAAESEEEVEVHRVNLGAFVPQPGIVSVTAVTGEPDGSITFDFVRDEVQPAFILEEDIHVAMALAFGDKEKILWPSLSLEREVERVLSDDYEHFQVKVWKPSWLGHTEYGRTLCVTDWLAGRLTWNPKAFTVAKPEDSFDPNFPEYIRNFLEDLRFTGGADKSAHSKRINVSPEYIPMEVIRSGNRWKVPLDTIKMRINGAYTQKREGEDIRDIGYNDTSFGQGRLTQRLTDHYPDIALMMPVFERARQLSGMTYGLIKLRDEGFQLSPTFQDTATKTLERFQALPPLSRAELTVKTPPFKLDFMG